MSANFAAARANMVESQVRTQDVTDLAIQDAMRSFPRETLTPADRAWSSYADAEVQYAPGRWLLRPGYVAKLLQALRPKKGEQALAIAAPYAGAILDLMGLAVSRLEGENLEEVSGLYDLIVCEGAVAAPPPAWTAALKVGGRLGVVLRSGAMGRATIYLRTPSEIGSVPVFDCTPPMMAGFEPSTRFVL